MKEFVQKMLRGRYVALLEEEVVRLRGENRALTNSLLGTAGFPPVDFPEALKPQGFSRLRKRSWHQIQMQREKGAAREAQLDGDERKHGLVSHN
ncbi:MAG TPA: hypothetical protein VGH83_12000 [Candidatus Acidoferrum sp.]|jgi:hypothetical protein